MDAQSFRRAEGARRDEYSVKDMMERVAVGDVINERYKTETEPPEGGVVFKPGKNDERTEEKIKHEMDDERIEQAVKEYKEVYENPMDCENLDCENVLEAVCGVKLENKRPKYRLFKNECFFRKVNCGLRYDYNRYRTVSIDQCDGVGSHLPPQEHAGWLQYQPRPLPRSQPSGGGGGQSSGRRSASRRDYDEIKNIPTRKYNQRKLERWPNGFKHDLIASQAQYKSKMMQYLSRALGSRTAMTANTNGLPCDHFCPVRCPEVYAPVCAYTYPQRARVFQNHCLLDLQSCNDGSAITTHMVTCLPCDHFCPVRCPEVYAPVCAYTYPQRARVFQNHCLLDLQSCNDGSVWQERALSECAGDVRAEVHERAAFIGWMQRMGILDKKGHLVQ
ncbi:uncharacterized protein LOC134677668 [Cydia fagiglandana]|uniref:uncharacterized protein LOC134677668 n=1 Tax=Cydia fagiglandana TaxID=1458189 RepID=UPI002FEE2CD0